MSGTDAAAVMTLFSSFYSETYCNAAVSVLFFYEALITFDREVAYFQNAKWVGALLFFANRYISMALYVSALVKFAPFPSNESCAIFQILGIVGLGILQFIPGAVFSALRAYALGRSKLLALLVLSLSLAPVGANLVIYGYDLSGAIFIRPLGCLQTENIPREISLRSVVVFARVPLIIADVLLIYITWTKLSIRATVPDIRDSKRLSLSDVLYRDGSIHFAVLFVLNMMHLVFSVNVVLVEGSGASYVAEFTAPITAILISRFLLELQEADRAVVRLNPDDPLCLSKDPYDSTPSFISSIGAFIHPDLPGTRHDDSEWHADSGRQSEDAGEA